MDLNARVADYSVYYCHRIEDMGDNDIVIANAETKSTLHTSRSFGDIEFKQNKNLSVEEQAVIAVPEITLVDRSNRCVCLNFVYDCCAMLLHVD